MKLTLGPPWGRGNEKVSLSRQREAALRWEGNVEVAVRGHELSRVGGEARRNGATMRTRTSAAQPQCGQTGSVGEMSGVGLSSGSGWPVGDCAWSSARASCSRTWRPRLASKP